MGVRATATHGPSTRHDAWFHVKPAPATLVGAIDGPAGQRSGGGAQHSGRPAIGARLTAVVGRVAG